MTAALVMLMGRRILVGGVPLFGGLVTRTRLEFVAHLRFQGQAPQVVARVRR